MKKKAFGLAVVFIVAAALWLVSFPSKEKDLVESKVVMIEAATEAEWEAAITEAIVAYEAEWEAAMIEAIVAYEAELEWVITTENVVVDRAPRIADTLPNDLVEDGLISGLVEGGLVEDEIVNELVSPGEDELSERARNLNSELFVKKLVSKLSTATSAYNRLTELWYQKPETIVYRLDLSSPSVPELAASLKGDTVHVEAPITPYISVELTGSAGLDINSKGRTKQRVSDTSPTEWIWTITPISTGDQLLFLKVYLHLSLNTKSEPHGVKIYTDEITVKVKPWTRLTMVVATIQPIWAFVGIVIAALVGVYGWFRREGWRADRKPVVSIIKGIYRGKNND